jgi:hypothetical protein
MLSRTLEACFSVVTDSIVSSAARCTFGCEFLRPSNAISSPLPKPSCLTARNASGKSSGQACTIFFSIGMAWRFEDLASD